MQQVYMVYSARTTEECISLPTIQVHPQPHLKEILNILSKLNYQRYKYCKNSTEASNLFGELF